MTGRLCLFGEHSDWAGEFRDANPSIAPGRTVVVGTREGLHASVSRTDAPVLRMRCVASDGTEHGPHDMPLDDDDALEREVRSGDQDAKLHGARTHARMHAGVRWWM